MSQVYLGTIQAFGFQFAPQGWAQCKGQLLNVAQNSALFALLGTTYGGNGQTNFALPNLGGRTIVGQGQSPGTSNYVIGQSAGVEQATLLSTNLPAHTHQLMAVAGAGTAATPGGNLLANASGLDSVTDNAVNVTVYAPATGGTLTPMAPNAIGPAGQGQAFQILQPYLAINFCIALVGIFPSRN